MMNLTPWPKIERLSLPYQLDMAIMVVVGVIIMLMEDVVMIVSWVIQVDISCFMMGSQHIS